MYQTTYRPPYTVWKYWKPNCERREKQNEYLEAQVEDLKGQREQLRADVEAWRSAATQKRLTWRGLFGGRGSAGDA